MDFQWFKPDHWKKYGLSMHEKCAALEAECDKLLAMEPDEVKTLLLSAAVDRYFRGRTVMVEMDSGGWLQ